MPKYRVDGLYEDGKARESAFKGIHYGAGVGMPSDGVYTQRKYMVASVVTNPAAAETIVVGGKTLQFLATPLLSTDIKIGALMVNGDLTYPTAIGWAVPNTWTYNGTTNRLTHIAGTHNGDPYLNATDDGGVTPVIDNIQAVYQNTWKPVVGRTYTVVFTVTGRTAGTVTASIGGAGTTARSTNATFTEAIVALTDAPLSFTPTKTFDGYITAISVTDGVTDYKLETAANIINVVNNLSQVTGGTAVTAYALGLGTLILFVANVIDATPTFTADGAKVIADIAWTNTIAQNKLDHVNYFKIDPTTDKATIPTVLVERNAGTFRNFLY